MQVSPPEWPVAPQAATAPRTRGFLLSAFLVLGMIGNMIAGAMDLLAGAAASRAAKDQLESMNADGANAIAHTSKMLHFMALAAFGHVVFMTGMWMWKKWGVYGYGCLLLFGSMIGMKESPVASIVSLVWGAIIAAIVMPRWKHFE